MRFIRRTKYIFIAMPTRQLLLFFILIFLALPTLRAAVPLQPVATATTVSISQSPPIEPKTKKIRKKLPDAPLLIFFIATILLALGLGTMLTLGLAGVVASGWVLAAGLGHLLAAILMLIMVFWADSWLALAMLLLLPLLLLFTLGTGFLIGGLLAGLLWAWLTGGLILLLFLLLLLSFWFSRKKI
jgi:hypothetical protein